MFPLLTLKKKQQDPVNVTRIPTAYIESHGSFNFGQQTYPDGKSKSRHLDGFSESAILNIEFPYLNIGGQNTCGTNVSGDMLSIITDQVRVFTCSDVSSPIPPRAIHLPTNTSWVEVDFTANRHQGNGGFLLKYSGIHLFS